MALCLKRTWFLYLWLLAGTDSFLVQPRRLHKKGVIASPLPMGDSSDSLDEMRRSLQASWNTDRMGKLPITPLDAANEAGGSLLTAKERGLTVVLINLLLPSYDITMGSNLYDEVEAVSFCVALCEFLEGKASIVVRDDKTVQVVSRILEARSKEEETAKSKFVLVDKEDYEEEEEGVEEEEEAETEEGGDEVGAEGFAEKEEKSDRSAELEDFRRQLLMGWNEDEDTPPLVDDTKMEDPITEDKTDMLNPAPKTKGYRLTSMLGDAEFTRGPDMFEKVIQAVSANGQPKDDEDTMVILSANSEEETIGIRALVAKYAPSKMIVLVNCQMNPIPRELLKAETVYSLLPLIAKPIASKSDASKVSQPKVIVLRRYPRDFEVFMDFGTGFELTETATTDQVGRTGPTLEWVAERVKRQMDRRLW